jgi:tungstate transport system ATP-binding protein
MDPAEESSAVTPLLEIRDLSVRRAGRQVLQISRLEMHSGEILAVVGPNGAGKSTLLLALTRLLVIEKGEIVLDGQDAHAAPVTEYRRRIALVLQDPLLFDVSVFENVASGLSFRGVEKVERQRRVMLWLDRLGVGHLRDRRADQLSGGEAQRVSLARALVLEPQLLLLDEPFSALDPPTREHLLADLADLLSEMGIMTIFVTHDLHEAVRLGDRVAVLIGGHLRQADAPDKVFEAPADADVAAFVGMETVLPGFVLRSFDEQVLVQVRGFELEAIGDVAPGREVLFCIRPEDVTLWKVDSVAKSSARNRLHGYIKKVIPQGALVRVVIDCGFSLRALVTHSSSREMGLAEGDSVTATFKASAVHLIPR